MEVSRKVFFIGSWKTKAVTDQLLLQISSQMRTKKGYATVVKLSPEGMELNILNDNNSIMRKDRVPLQNIADLAENRHSTVCVLAIVRDQFDMYKVLVFLCSSEKDAGDLVQGYARLKKKLSGEGYNFDLKPKGTNWTLVSKSEPVKQTEYVVTRSDNVVSGSNVIVNGGNSGVRVFTHNRDGSNVSARREDLPMELNNLAGEVRDIKNSLQQPKTMTYVNEYGYRFTADPIPVQTHLQEVRTAKPQPAKYIRREGGIQSIAYRGSPVRLASSTSTQKHYLSSNTSLPGSMRLGYQTKTVRSPLAIAHSSPMVVEHRRDMRRSGGSDIVQKNIEDVYKHRLSRRIVVYPQQDRTVEYVHSAQPLAQRVTGVQSPPPKIAVSNQVSDVKNIHYDTVGTNVMYENNKNQDNHHEVRYVSEERSYHGEPSYHREPIVVSESSNNVSTIVNTSVHNDLDDNVVHRDSAYDYSQEHGLIREETDQVIIYRAPRHGGHRYVKRSEAEVRRKPMDEDRNENVIYINQDDNRHHYANTNAKSETAASSTTSEDGVYHVRIQGVDAYNKQHTDDVSRNNVERESVTVVHSQQPSGLWGAYTSHPQRDDSDAEMRRESAYMYHDDDETTAMTVQTTSIEHEDQVQIVDFVDDDVNPRRNSVESLASSSKHSGNNDGEVQKDGKYGGSDRDPDDDKDDSSDEEYATSSKHVKYAQKLEETIEDKHVDDIASTSALSQKIHDTNNNPDDTVTGLRQRFEGMSERSKDKLEEVEKAANRKLINDEITKRVIETSEQTVLF